MKKMEMKRGRRGPITVALKTFVLALALGTAAPAIGGIAVPTPAEAQLTDLRQVKRFLLWDICTSVRCMGGYCCGWTGF